MKSYIIPSIEIHKLETSPFMQDMSLIEEVGTGGQLSNMDIFDEEDGGYTSPNNLWDNPE